jgi:hypothetical protein
LFGGAGNDERLCQVLLKFKNERAQAEISNSEMVDPEKDTVHFNPRSGARTMIETSLQAPVIANSVQTMRNQETLKFFVALCNWRCSSYDRQQVKKFSVGLVDEEDETHLLRCKMLRS